MVLNIFSLQFIRSCQLLIRFILVEENNKQTLFSENVVRKNYQH